MLYSQQEATDLQVCIESINEKHDEESAAAKAKIATLTRKLRTSEEKIDSLEYELAEAIELINFFVNSHPPICSHTVHHTFQPSEINSTYY